MNTPNTPPYQAWLEKAAHDVTALNRIMIGSGVPWDTVCVHAQQATEKTLKAFLVFHSSVPPKTHDCNQLLSLCEAFDSSLAVFRDDCILVTRYGVAPRYPDFIPDPTEQEARAVIAAMERIRIAVLVLLPA